MSVFTDPAADEQLAVCEEEVVFAESFEPRELFGREGSCEAGFLTALALRCDPVLAPQSAMHWALKPDVRFAVLKRLAEREELHVRATMPLRFVNGFGLWMVQLLKEQAVDVETLSNVEQAKLRTAAQFVQTFLPVGLNDRLESQLEWAQTKRALRVALPTGLLGRTALLQKLKRGITAVPSAGGGPAANVLLVTGVGGSGKSALLAELVLEHSELADCPMVCLDFDSPSLAVPRSDRLMMAFARQLAMHYPEHAGPLRQFARELERFLVAGEHDSTSYRDLSYTTSVVRSAWEKRCADFGIEELPTVVVLDTFEEVLIRGQAELRLVEQWVQSLVYEYGFHHLAIVVSGRTLPNELFRQVSPLKPLRVEVGDLSRTWATKFLRLQAGGRLATEQARALVERHGGNPLMLRLLGRLVREGDQDFAVDHRLDREAAQSFLYDRILKRLRSSDQAVAEVAHPGLVLRRITPSIIREVLAGPLGLGKLTEARARALFDELARQVWLVEPGGSPNVLVHRKDLRRLMLKLMYHDRPAQLEAVHQAAVTYYTDGNAQDLDLASAKLEANYHRLFVLDPQLEHADALALVRSLGADIECLPLTRSARLRQQARVDLTEAELATLAPEERALEQDRARTRMYKVASESVDHRVPSLVAAEGGPVLSGADIEYLFADGDWHGITSRAHTWFSEQLGSARVGDAEINSLVESHLWKVCLALLFDITATKSQVLAAQQHLAEWAADSGKQPYVQGKRHRISSIEAVEAAAGLFRQRGSQSFTAGWDRPTTLYTVDEARLWLLRPLSKEVRRWVGADLHVHPSVFRFLSDEFEAALEDVNHPLGVSEQMRDWVSETQDLVFHGSSLELIASVASDARPLHFQGSASAIRRLGGFMLPELYPLCRRALRAVPAPLLSEFATVEAAKDQFWPRDVAGELFETQLAGNIDRGISVLLEVSDRLGLVPALLRYGLRHVDNPHALRRALQAWRRLERRLSPPSEPTERL